MGEHTHSQYRVKVLVPLVLGGSQWLDLPEKYKDKKLATARADRIKKAITEGSSEMKGVKVVQRKWTLRTNVTKLKGDQGDVS